MMSSRAIITLYRESPFKTSLSFFSLPQPLPPSLPTPSLPSSVLPSMFLSTLYEASTVVYFHMTFQRLSLLVISPWTSSSALPCPSPQIQLEYTYLKIQLQHPHIERTWDVYVMSLDCLSQIHLPTNFICFLSL